MIKSHSYDFNQNINQTLNYFNMKRIISAFFMLLFTVIYSQDPATLGIGLETLTFNKGSINVEVLTKIILKKQRELKNEALKRFMFKMFPESDYTTRFYVQNCLNILLNEKNPQVIEKEILELTTNYAIALGVTQAVDKMQVFEGMGDKKNIHIDYTKLKKEIEFNSENLEKNLFDLHIENMYINNESIDLKKNKLKILERIKEIEKLEKKIKKEKRQLARNGVKYDLTAKENINKPQVNVNFLTFGEKLDLVSLALSENDLLRKKGFFKNRIDYQADQGYFISFDKDTTIVKNINKKINPYIENYDIIKNILNDIEINGIKNEGKTFIDELTKMYLNQFDYNYNFSDLSKNIFILDDKIKKDLNKLNDYLKLKDNLIKIEGYKDVKFQKEKINHISTLSENYDQDNINLITNDLTNYKNQYYEVLKFNKLTTNYKKLYDEINPVLIKIQKEELKSINLINLILPDEDVFIKEINELIGILTTISDSSTFDVNKENINTKIEKLNSYLNVDPNIANNVKSNIDIDIDIDNTDLFNDLKNNLDNYLKATQESITKNNDFFNIFIKQLLTVIETSTSTKTLDDPKINQDLANLLANVYERLSYFKNSNIYTISDINFLEKELLPKLVGYNFIVDSNKQDNFNKIIKGIKNLTPLLKIRILNLKFKDNAKIEISNEKELLSLFEFIGNLDKLDKAQTYSSIISLIQSNSENIVDVLPDGEFKDSYKIFINGVKKYTLINPSAEKQYVEIDVVSFLDDLQQYYNRKNPSQFSLYFTIGINQNFFFKNFQFPDTQETINNIGFASEKLGLKFKILDFNKDRNYENVIKSDVYLNRRAPFINEWYASLYGSGLLYSLANTATNKNFNFPHVGLSTGFRFYNALDFNVMLGFPFVKNQPFGNNAFFGIGFDVPLGEYLEALGNK